MPVSLGGMINEARILVGPSPPPLRPRGRAPHMKLAYAAHLPGREPLMILLTPLYLQSPKQHSKAMPDPGLGDTLLTLCGCEGGLLGKEQHPYTCSSVKHISLKPYCVCVWGGGYSLTTFLQ